MTSNLAQEDLDDLRAAGLKPTDEDIIRLHALANRITSGDETNASSVPRYAVVGGAVIFEPTMAAREWFAFARRFAADTVAEDWMFCFACVHGREYNYLSQLRNPAEIERAIGVFLGAFTGTFDEMERALEYVTFGVDEIEPEKTELAKARQKEECITVNEREARNLSMLEDVLQEASVATGYTYSDIMAQTPSRLVGMIYKAHIQAGMTVSKSSARAYAEYMATLNAVSKRLREEASSPTKD